MDGRSVKQNTDDIRNVFGLWLVKFVSDIIQETEQKFMHIMLFTGRKLQPLGIKSVQNRRRVQGDLRKTCDGCLQIGVRGSNGQSRFVTLQGGSNVQPSKEICHETQIQKALEDSIAKTPVVGVVESHGR
jgi:hypothetical protein